MRHEQSQSDRGGVSRAARDAAASCCPTRGTSAAPSTSSAPASSAGHDVGRHGLRAAGCPTHVGRCRATSCSRTSPRSSAATSLPVNADFQSGYAATSKAWRRTCARASRPAWRLSIEDASGDAAAPLYSLDEAVRRLRAARKAIDDSGSGVVLTGALRGVPRRRSPSAREEGARSARRLRRGRRRLLVRARRARRGTIAAIVRAVAPKPVNVLVSSPGLTVARLAALGVRRVSVGSALARVAWGAFIRRRARSSSTERSTTSPAAAPSPSWTRSLPTVEAPDEEVMRMRGLLLPPVALALALRARQADTTASAPARRTRPS